MTRCFCGIALLTSLMLGAGCATCESSLDYGPSAFGGVCADGACGARAGSIITPHAGEFVKGVVEPAAADQATPAPLPAEDVPAPAMEADPVPRTQSNLVPPAEDALPPDFGTDLTPPSEADLGPAPESGVAPIE
jgi:hypothetical protein